MDRCGFGLRRRGGDVRYPIAPSASASATFEVTSPKVTGAGFVTGKAAWTNQASRHAESETVVQRVRNVLPIKINEVRFGTTANSTDQFIELYNPTPDPIDVSNWSVINTQSQWAPVTLATIPSGTTLAAGAYYLLGLSSSGLATPAKAGDTLINVRSTTGFETGQKIDIDGESRTITTVGTAATAMTTVFVPVSTGPWLAIPAGSTNLPVANASGFAVGQRVGIDAGGNYELATVTAVGRAASQTTLAAAASAGATNIKVTANADMSVGDTLTVGTGSRKELVTIASVGTPGPGGTGVELAAPLRFAHRAEIDVSDVGTGISFSPATKFPHTSGDAVQALGSGVTLDAALVKGHAYGAAVVNARVATEGYQGLPAPNQWFGGSLSSRAGSIVLTDATGEVVVDGMVYGSQQSDSSGNGTIASPEIATLEGDQGKGGCIVVVPVAAGGPGTSRGRFPDGADADSNCTDFLLQSATTLSAALVGRLDQRQGRQRHGLRRGPVDCDRHGREPRDRGHRHGWHRGRHDGGHGHQRGRVGHPGRQRDGLRRRPSHHDRQRREPRDGGRRLHHPRREVRPSRQPGAHRHHHRVRAAHLRARCRCAGVRLRHHAHDGPDEAPCQRGADRRPRAHAWCAQPVLQGAAVRGPRRYALQRRPSPSAGLRAGPASDAHRCCAA